ERMFQPETGGAPVQILGAFETPGLRFEHLWVAGLDDESWPPAPKPVPFLPASLQRELGLPHASPGRELAFTRSLTARLLASAGDAVVSHATRAGDRVLAASPLIRDIPAGEPAAPLYPLYRDAVRASSQLEEIGDHAAPPVEGSAASGGTRVFRDQASCPFRAFAELRLGAQPLESPAPGLNPMERGNLVHNALESIWRELGSHARLRASGGGELSALIRSSIAGALAKLEARRGDKLPERFAALEAQRLERILNAWLELEKQRSPFIVLETEAERQATAGGVSCKVKVDRIDRLADGREVIVDYKTGIANTRAWTGERPDEPQLPLYAVTHDCPVAAVLFGQIKAGEIGFKGYAETDGIAPGAETRQLAEDLAEWRRVLDRLGSDFRAGVADVNPKDANACRRCTLLPLCRFGDVEAPTSAFDGNGNDD
ncbi:MAG TPA: PD-(D/E)XK nuclease family protein, partial [Bryobacteraceae bacterium]